MSDTALLTPGFAARTLSDIATTVPGATAVFRRRKLDFCCGGKAALSEAAAEKGLPLDEIVSELSALGTTGETTGLPEKTTNELIDLILTRYHAAHRRDLPELIKLARRVEVVHRAKPAVPTGLGDLLAGLEGEMEVHMKKEELVLFPAMRRGAGRMIATPLAAMMSEHDDQGVKLREMEAMTDDFTPPAEACATWRALYVGARRLADDMMEHIHTENNVLFPRFLG
jgi:regulator of cell morphogenesis and NO signaling